jgi:diguanylate cyclase
MSIHTGGDARRGRDEHEASTARSATGADQNGRPNPAASRDHQHTFAYARSALERIAALRHPADPPSFEVWYVYSTGNNPRLNQAINDKLRCGGTLTIAELDRIHEELLSPTALAAHLDSVGDKLGIAVDRIGGMIETAAGSMATYGESLAGTGRSLGDVHDGEALRAVVESLAQATRRAEEENLALQAQLSSSKQEIRELQSNLEDIRRESITDALTKLANRKHFDQALDLEIKHGGCEAPLSLLLCDVDHFKKFNDRFGHVTGDHVLRLLAAALRNTIRGQDLAARYGGEEFAIILPNTTLHQAMSVAENIRSAVMQKEIIKRTTGESLGRITVSIGAAAFRADDTSESFIERADLCLYAAKRRGRNQVVSEINLQEERIAS